jgi:hypothetical protein
LPRKEENMKDFNLAEVFCEVLGGGLAILLVIAFLDLSDHIDIIPLLKDATAASIGNVTVALIGSYLVGLLVDAVGLTVGELYFDRLVCKEKPPTTEQQKLFWQHADEYVVKYRENQWTFYSAYRIVFLLLIPGTIIFPSVVWKHTNLCLGLTSLALAIGLEVSLFFSARCLLKIYYSIPKHFSEAVEGIVVDTDK